MIGKTGRLYQLVELLEKGQGFCESKDLISPLSTSVFRTDLFLIIVNHVISRFSGKCMSDLLVLLQIRLWWGGIMFILFLTGDIKIMFRATDQLINYIKVYIAKILN